MSEANITYGVIVGATSSRTVVGGGRPWPERCRDARVTCGRWEIGFWGPLR